MAFGFSHAWLSKLILRCAPLFLVNLLVFSIACHEDAQLRRALRCGVCGGGAAFCCDIGIVTNALLSLWSVLGSRHIGPCRASRNARSVTMDLHTSFTTFDYVVIGCVLLSGLLALIRGLVREVCSLAAWAGAFVAAAKLSYLAEPWAHRYVKSDSLASQLAMLAMFCGAFIVLSLIGMLISKLIRGDALTAIDRSLGFVFGLLRGALLVCLLYLVAISTLWPDLDVPATSGNGAVQYADRSAGNDLAMPPPIAKSPSQQGEGRDAFASRGDEKHPLAKISWLEQSKTRPFLAHGAHWLRSLMPANAAEIARERQGAFERQLEHGARELIIQQGQGALPASNDHSQSYDNNSRSGMDALIDKNGGNP